jgi:L-histidine Nalpha-methyltransferase
MSCPVQVTIHSSQFPAVVSRERVACLRRRQVNHKFHYDSIQQTNQWLALHQAYAPSRLDPDCVGIYEAAFTRVAARTAAARVLLIGLGCGGGRKDTQLLRRLQAAGRELWYMPCDVSTAMVIVAREAASESLPESHCFPLVCDLAVTADLGPVVERTGAAAGDATRLITFFGMIPNFEPQLILPRLAELVRPGEWLLFSANLAPGPDYAAGVRRVLPLYDNTLTRDWLMTFLRDLGVEREDGELRFVVEADPGGEDLQRIAAYFEFQRARRVLVEAETVEFGAGERVRLFYSYRHTSDRVRQLLGRYGLHVEEEWITRSEEEGVFLVRRAA